MQTPAQIGQSIKQQYPGSYDQYPDEVVGQRALLKNPSLGDSSMGDVAMEAVKDATFQPGATTTKIMSDPITQAQALPAIAGTTAGAMGVPMGSSLGTGAGHLLADAALKSYGRSDLIPSTKSQVMGTGAAALGDLTAIPAINKANAGSQISAAEDLAGVPPPQQIPSLPKPAVGAPVSGGIDETIKAVDNATSQGAGSPVFWKQIKDQIDSFYNAGKQVKLTQLDQNKLAYLSKAVQSGLNESVPGRAAPAAYMAMSQTVPDIISAMSGSLPWWIKGAGTLIGGDALTRALGGMMGSKHQ